MEQTASITITREDQARALSQNVGFLAQFVQPRSPSEVAPRLGMAANLVHHHARKLEALGLLFEQRREGGRVYHQLAALEFRHAHDLLPPEDPDENVVRHLRSLSEQFVAAHARSWRVAEREGDQGQMVFGFGAEVPVRPTAPPMEPHPTHFDRVTLRLTPERYQRLARDLSRLMDEAMREVEAAGRGAMGAPCTLAVLAYQGELALIGEGTGRAISSFLAGAAAPA